MAKKSTKKIRWLILMPLVLLFVFHGWLRFWDLEGRMQFQFDQIQNAWVMKNMIIDGKMPLLGMVAKGNSGFYIGPGYYYLLAPFYALFHMDPIAAGVFVGVVSVVTLAVLVFVMARLFSYPSALVAGFIYTASYQVVGFDRIPWPVNLIPLVSLIIFYCLYRVVSGESKYLMGLALASGFAFHIHFTAVYFPLIILSTVPFCAKHKNFFRYVGISFPLFFIWFIPNFIAEAQTKFKYGGNLLGYVDTYYHGFHLRRVFQLLKDAFIEFEYVLVSPMMKPLKYVLLWVGIFLFFRSFTRSKAFILGYLFVLWFLVPLVVMSVYSGEITNYYFSITRPMIAMVMGFVTVWFFERKYFVPGMFLAGYWIYFAYINVKQFVETKNPNLPRAREQAQQAIDRGIQVPFSEGDPVPYLQYMYEYQQKNKNQQ